MVSVIPKTPDFRDAQKMLLNHGRYVCVKKNTLGQSQGKWWYNWNGLIIINQPHMPYVIPRVPPYFHIFSHLGRWKKNRGDACIAFSISRSFASFFAFLSWSVSCCTHRSEIRLYNHLSSEWNSKNWDILLISTGSRWTSQPSTVSLGAIFTGAFFATFFSIFFSFLAAFRKPEVSFKKKRSVQLEKSSVPNQETVVDSWSSRSHQYLQKLGLFGFLILFLVLFVLLLYLRIIFICFMCWPDQKTPPKNGRST